MTKPVENQAVFTATVEELPNICQLIHEAAVEHGMDEASVWKLETAVDEACTNIASYGYCGRNDGLIWLKWGSHPDGFYVVIEDEGVPFDQTMPTQPDFTSELCKRKAGGLGRFIMRQFVDELDYQRNNDRNTLTLIKKLHDHSSK